MKPITGRLTEKNASGMLSLISRSFPGRSVNNRGSPLILTLERAQGSSTKRRQNLVLQSLWRSTTATTTSLKSDYPARSRSNEESCVSRFMNISRIGLTGTRATLRCVRSPRIE